MDEPAKHDEECAHIPVSPLSVSCSLSSKTNQAQTDFSHSFFVLQKFQHDEISPAASGQLRTSTEQDQLLASRLQEEEVGEKSQVIFEGSEETANRSRHGRFKILGLIPLVVLALAGLYAYAISVGGPTIAGIVVVLTGVAGINLLTRHRPPFKRP